MLTIWGRINSHNVKKVVWLAEEMGLAYDRRDVGGPFGMDAGYRALNPNALIPTIEDDGFVLWESNSILRYLAANHGGEAFYRPIRRREPRSSGGWTGASPGPMRSGRSSSRWCGPKPTSATQD